MLLTITVAHSYESVPVPTPPVTPVLLKLNCPPSLLQLDLHGSVDADSARVRIEAGNVVHISVAKASESRGAWPALTCDASLDKVSRLQRRHASLLAAESLAAARASDAVAARKRAEQASRETHWEIDARQRQAVHDIANRERVVATEDLAAWKKTIEAQSAKPGQGPLQEAEEDGASVSTPAKDDALVSASAEVELPELDDGDDAAAAAPAPAAKKARDSSIWGASEQDSAAAPAPTSAAAPSASKAATAAAPAAPLPPVRRNAAVSISFTKGATAAPSMPARESTMAQKLAFDATRGAAGAAASPPVAEEQGGDREARERVPLFLKEKGDKLARDGDLLGGVAAYTAAIERDTALQLGTETALQSSPMLRARCHSNRAALLLRLASSRADVASIADARARLRSAAGDCTTALTILDSALPAAPATGSDGSGAAAQEEYAPAVVLDALALRLKLLHRRATCFAWLGWYALAARELRALVPALEDAQTLELRLQRQWEEGRHAAQAQESGDGAAPASDGDAAVAAAAPAPLPKLPALDPAALRGEAEMFEQLLASLSAGQLEAYKAEGDRLLASAAGVGVGAVAVAEGGSERSAQAVAAYTSALLLHPSCLPALSNRSLAQLQCRRWKEAVQDCTLALALWDELWITPRTGLQAVAPAPPPENPADNPAAPLPSALSFSSPAPRAATAVAIGARVRLVVRRATARAGLRAWVPVQADLQHALALLPLSATAAAPVTPASLASLRSELECAQFQVGLGTATRKAAASLALSAAGAGAAAAPKPNHAAAVALYTGAIEFHAKWQVNESSAVERAAAWVATGSAAGADPSQQPQQQPQTVVSAQLAHVSTLAALLSDRSAAHLHARNYAACIQGCSVAMQVWSQQVAHERQSKGGAFGSGAHVHSAPTPAWWLCTLIRRGSARAFQGDLHGAAADYQEALASWSPDAASTPQLQDQRKQVQDDLQRIQLAAAQLQA